MVCISSSFIPGLSFFDHAGQQICPTITDSTPASKTARYTFPKEFLWGSAMWASGSEQAAYEDGKAPTVWDFLYEINPKRFFSIWSKCYIIGAIWSKFVS